MTYAVLMTRGHSLPRERDFTIFESGLPSLAVAKARRVTAGDLVVDTETLRIDQSQEWLFDWEKENAQCYARLMQRLDREGK